MHNLLEALSQKRFAPGVVHGVVLRQKQRGLAVEMIYDTESGQYPLCGKVRLRVPQEDDIIIHLPRHHEDGTVPAEFNDGRYRTRTNVTYDTGRKLIGLLQELLGQSH